MWHHPSPRNMARGSKKASKAADKGAEKHAKHPPNKATTDNHTAMSVFDDRASDSDAADREEEKTDTVITA